MALLSDYIRRMSWDFPGRGSGAHGGEGERGHSHSGEVLAGSMVGISLTSRGFPAVGTRELLRLFRNHWPSGNSLHHGEGPQLRMRTSTRCAVRGWARYSCTLVNTGLNALRLEGWSASPPYPCHLRQPRLAPSAQRRPSPASTVELTDFAIVLPHLRQGL